MSQLTFRVDYPQSFARGVDCPVPPTVTIDVDPATLDPADREAIAAFLQPDGVVRDYCEEGSHWDADHRRYHERPILAPAASLEALLATVRERQEAIRTWPERRAAAQAVEAPQRREQSLADLANPHYGERTAYRQIDSLGRLITSDYSHVDPLSDVIAARPYTWGREWQRYLHDDEVRASTAAQLAAATHERLTAQRERLAREPVDAELLAIYEELRTWIAAHGSPRLRALAAAGVAHRKTYVAERAKHEAREFDRLLAEQRPGWYAAEESDYTRDVADVGLRTLVLLNAARLDEPEAVLAKRTSDGRYVALAMFEGRLIAWPSDREAA